MTPAVLRRTVVTERAAWIRNMLCGIRALLLESLDAFRGDPRNVAAAESYLRRPLEALLDLGRHQLAEGFAVTPTEYREIARELEWAQVLGAEEARRLQQLAGYRNRLVLFYHEVGVEELYDICARRAGDIESLLERILKWIQDHPDRKKSIRPSDPKDPPKPVIKEAQ